MQRRYFPIGLALGLALTGASSAALGQSRSTLCVTCSGPEAVYRCEVEAAPGAIGARPAFQLFCISRLAADGGHASCAVRKTADTVCDGVAKSFVMEAGAGTAAPLLAGPGPGPAHSQTLAPPAGAAPATDGGPPRTVAEAASRAVAASSDGVSSAGGKVKEGAQKAGSGLAEAAQKTGAAVGGAAKSTWKCLSSLFSDCK